MESMNLEPGAKLVTLEKRVCLSSPIWKTEVLFLSRWEVEWGWGMARPQHPEFQQVSSKAF